MRTCHAPLEAPEAGTSRSCFVAGSGRRVGPRGYDASSLLRQGLLGERHGFRQHRDHQRCPPDSSFRGEPLGSVRRRLLAERGVGDHDGDRVRLRGKRRHRQDWVFIIWWLPSRCRQHALSREQLDHFLPSAVRKPRVPNLDSQSAGPRRGPEPHLALRGCHSRVRP